jgi:hypothetical protein
MVAGILLLANRWKGLALILAAIISVNIVLFRIILDSNGIGIALFAAILNALLIHLNWSIFTSLFNTNLNKLSK